MPKQKIKEFPIREFPLHEMPLNSKCVIIGNPGSGKSELIKDILNVVKHKIPTAKVFNGNEGNNHFYSEILHDAYVFPEYDEEEMRKFRDRQSKAMESSNNPWSVKIIDDCSDDPKLFNHPIFQQYAKNGRHWKMLFILALQYAMDIKPGVRKNFDYFFIYRDPIEKSRKTLYENYASIIGDYQDFCEIMDQITGDYTALVIHNRAQSNDPTKCVYYYRARSYGKDVKFGSQEYHQWAEQRYDSNYKKNLF